MTKVTLRDLEIAGRRLLVRADFDVSLRANQTIADDRRIRATLPTINFARQAGAALVLLSHRGDPRRHPQPDLSQAQVAHRLQQLLPNARINFLPEIVGPAARKQVEKMEAGEVLVLENLRFHPGEESGSEAFAAQLAELGNLYINDDFAASYRRDASLEALPLCFAEEHRAIGFLMERELDRIDTFLDRIEPPWVVLLGGTKVEEEMALIEALGERVDHFLLGGALAYTLLHALGVSMGQSLLAESLVDRGQELLAYVGEKMLLPVDHVIICPSGAAEEAPLVAEEVPAGWAAVDIGPQTIASFRQAIERARAAFWYGPLGKLEGRAFYAGSESIARALVARGAPLLAGGEATVQLLKQFNLASRFDHVSTGGRALLRYLSDRRLPALSVIGEPQAV